jgi:hypothetical protein
MLGIAQLGVKVTEDDVLKLGKKFYTEMKEW